MPNETLLESVLAWLAKENGAEALRIARARFEQETGPIEEGAADYEARIDHFLEHHLCTGDPAPVALYASRERALLPAERRELAGWLRSHRSLFTFVRFEGQVGLLRDRLCGGAFCVCLRDRDRQLQPGDCFDGRLLPLPDGLWMTAGSVYHPREAHSAIDALLAEVGPSPESREAMLNGLLAMRSRFQRFESIRAEHVYRMQSSLKL